jgi:hypothetical protein
MLRTYWTLRTFAIDFIINESSLNSDGLHLSIDGFRPCETLIAEQSSGLSYCRTTRPSHIEILHRVNMSSCHGVALELGTKGKAEPWSLLKKKIMLHSVLHLEYLSSITCSAVYIFILGTMIGYCRLEICLLSDKL